MSLYDPSNLYEDRSEAIDSADKIFESSSDPILKDHARVCILHGNGRFKHALTYSDGAYKGATLWVLENSTFTVRPEDRERFLSK